MSEAKHLYAFELKDESATMVLGKAVASVLPLHATVLLSGTLGVGKSCFARAVIQSLNPSITDVPSPTFTLVQLYDVLIGGTPSTLWHVDLYRIEREQEIEELGLLEVIGSQTVLIEWPERLGSLAPVDVFQFHFSLAPGGLHRMVSIGAEGRAKDELSRVINAISLHIQPS